MSVAVVVVTYAAAGTVESVLDRIPCEVHGAPPLVLVTDDAGPDDTAELATRWAAGPARPPTTVVRQPRNLGLGGNQKFGFRWALEQGATAAVVLHGDGQYPPERIADLVEPILAGDADAVFGSRMSTPGAARRGGMPLVKYVGNRTLSSVQNALAGTTFTEWYSGFRAYRPEIVCALDQAALADGFDYDPMVLLHLLDAGARIDEIPIATHYGDEVSRVRVVRDGVRILTGAVAHRARRSGAVRSGTSPARTPS